MTVTEIRAKLAAKLSGLESDQLRDLARKMNAASDSPADEFAIVRSECLREYERRHGGEAVNSFMDELGM